MVAIERDGSTALLRNIVRQDASYTWLSELIQYGAYLLIGVVAAVFSTAFLSVNLQPARKGRWMWRHSLAVIGLFVLNTMAALEAYTAFRTVVIKGNSPWPSTPAHLFIIAIAIMCTLAADVLFVNLFRRQNSAVRRTVAPSPFEAAVPDTILSPASFSGWPANQETTNQSQGDRPAETTVDPQRPELVGPDTTFVFQMNPGHEGADNTVTSGDLPGVNTGSGVRSPGSGVRSPGTSGKEGTEAGVTSKSSSQARKGRDRQIPPTNPKPVAMGPRQVHNPPGTSQFTLEERLKALKSQARRGSPVPISNPVNAPVGPTLPGILGQKPGLPSNPGPNLGAAVSDAQKTHIFPWQGSFANVTSGESSSGGARRSQGPLLPTGVLPQTSRLDKKVTMVPLRSPRDVVVESHSSSNRGSPGDVRDVYERNQGLGRGRMPRSAVPPLPKPPLVSALRGSNPIHALGTQSAAVPGQPVNQMKPEPYYPGILVKAPGEPPVVANLPKSVAAKGFPTVPLPDRSTVFGPTGGSKNLRASGSIGTPIRPAVVRFDTQLLLRSYRENRQQERRALRRARDDLSRVGNPPSVVRVFHSPRSLGTVETHEDVCDISIASTPLPEIIEGSVAGTTRATRASATNVTSESDLSKTLRTFLKNPWLWFKNLVLELVQAVQEEEGYFKYSVWIKSAALTTFSVICYTCIRTVHTLFTITNSWAGSDGAISQNIDRVKRYFREQAWFNNALEDIVVGMLEYIDTLIPVMRYTVWIGYPLGAIIGFYSLYSVMVQHKRLSLAMDLEMLAQDREREDEENRMTPASIRGVWPELEQKYPIGEAVYFLAILTSTAIIQLQIFGFLLSTGFAILGNIMNIGILMDGVGFYFVVYFGVYALDWIVLHILPDRVLSQNLEIKYPRVFFVYMFVFSIVHLVIGFFYALVRLFYMLLVAFLSLNRLDRCLFSKWRRLDNGHRAFMSMIVLTRLIDKESFKKADRGTKLLKSMTRIFQMASSTAGLSRIQRITSRLGIRRSDVGSTVVERVN